MALMFYVVKELKLVVVLFSGTSCNASFSNGRNFEEAYERC